ncbi:MAG: carbon-nitrogen hydrolase family protein [Myxococcota bacterium]
MNSEANEGSVRAAIVQVCATDDLERNLAIAGDGIAEAAARGAGLVALPENFAYMRREGSAFPCVQDENGEILRALSEWAKTHSVWLLGGTFPEAMADPEDARVYNTSVVFGPDGREVARYRKIHLFDVSLGTGGEDAYRESIHFAPGEEIVVADTAFGGVGLSVCYDLRFPELYRAMIPHDPHWITVPSAFTRETGKDHWEVLLRARAIESQTFVLAPAQCGEHSADRASYGRSMIIDPWGLVLAQAGDEPGVILADCSLDRLRRVRQAIPALEHRRVT